MVRNEKQYQVTKNRLKDFQEALFQIEGAEMNSVNKELHLNAIKSQLEDLKEELLEYEELKKGKCRYIEISSMSGIHEALIKARIGRGWTQGELANRLEMKEQQIQRYESSDYSTASMARITEVANMLEIEFPLLKIKIGPPQRPILACYGYEEIQRGFEKMIGNGTLLPEIS